MASRLTEPTGGYGGFMGIDLSTNTQHAGLSDGSIVYATARAGLAAILDVCQPTRVHAPSWICDTALVAAVERGIPVHAYTLDAQLRPVDPPIDDTAALTILVDYFGVTELPDSTGAHVVVDATQAWDRLPTPGRWTFKSARKLFGVPDGAPVWGPRSLPAPIRPADHRSTHLLLRALGDSHALRAARVHEASLSTARLGASPVSRALLAATDIEHHRSCRRANFARLHAHLGPHNRLSPRLGPGMPMAYPFLPPRPIPRAHFYAERVWVPQLWAERADAPDPWTAELSRELRPLPIDPRLRPEHIDHIAKVALRG